MNIDTSYSAFSYHSNHSGIQERYLKDADIKDRVEVQEHQPVQSSHNVISPVGEIVRQTYGLSVLEQMNDDEYRAFLRATAKMTESEKIFAAQSLYRLHQVYEQQFESKKNPYQMGHQDFLQVFQNAYAEILSQKLA